MMVTPKGIPKMADFRKIFHELINVMENKNIGTKTRLEIKSKIKTNKKVKLKIRTFFTLSVTYHHNEC